MSRKGLKSWFSVGGVVTLAASTVGIVVWLFAMGFIVLPALNGLVAAFLGGLSIAFFVYAVMRWIVNAHHLRIRWTDGRAMSEIERVRARAYSAVLFVYMFYAALLSVTLMVRAEIGDASLPTPALLAAIGLVVLVTLAEIHLVRQNNRMVAALAASSK